jgi:predicted oxidoreductase
MVTLINKDGSLLGEFEGEDSLFRYLQESLNSLGGQEAQRWQFTQKPPEDFVTLVKEREEASLIYKAWQAYLEERDFIIIGTGNAKKLSVFVVTPDLNVAALKREWCKLYCAAFGMRIRIG